MLTPERKKELFTCDPTQSDEARRLYALLWKVYTEIFAKAYFITSDILKIYTEDEGTPFSVQHFPASLITAHMINKSITLIDGPPGNGKTTLVRMVSFLMTGAPMDDSDNIIYCDEELDKDKWMGTPNVAKLMGEEGEKREFDITWAKWIVNDDIVDIIFDEINRANSLMQNEMLAFMADGRVQYDVTHIKKKKKYRVFFTQNPIDENMAREGIHALHDAFKDRITQCIRVSQPPRKAMKMFSKIRKDDRIDRDEDRVDDDEKDGLKYDKENDLKQVMTPDDLEAASILASRITVSPEADDYAIYLTKDLSLCLRADYFDKMQMTKENLAGQGLCNGCHFMGENVHYNCNKFYGGSMRMYKDLIAVSKAYAFFLGIKEVNEHVMQSIAMDVLRHRVTVLENVLRKDAKFGKSRDKFISEYLVNWCFQNLITRQPAEQAYKALYEGRGTEADANLLLQDSQNDIYVKIELLRDVVAVPDTLLESNLMETNEIFQSATDSTYKEIASSIVKIRDDLSTPAMQKFNDLNTILENINKQPVPFASNLVSMIYMLFPVLIKEMKDRPKYSSKAKKKAP